MQLLLSIFIGWDPLLSRVAADYALFHPEIKAITDKTPILVDIHPVNHPPSQSCNQPSKAAADHAAEYGNDWTGDPSTKHSASYSLGYATGQEPGHDPFGGFGALLDFFPSLRNQSLELFLF
jgi:hypothetical protein